MVRQVVRDSTEVGSVSPSGSMEDDRWPLAPATPLFSRAGTLADFVLYNQPRVV